MNIKLEYLYRDAANNKEWGDVVFGNTECLSAEEVASRAEPHLIDGLWFVADKVGLPGLFAYPYDPELDHDRHEVVAFTLTDDPVTDPQQRDITDFLTTLQVVKKNNIF